jgi:hypothetical protein
VPTCHKATPWNTYMSTNTKKFKANGKYLPLPTKIHISFSCPVLAQGHKVLLAMAKAMSVDYLQLTREDRAKLVHAFEKHHKECARVKYSNVVSSDNVVRAKAHSLETQVCPISQVLFEVLRHFFCSWRT